MNTSLLSRVTSGGSIHVVDPDAKGQMSHRVSSGESVASTVSVVSSSDEEDSSKTRSGAVGANVGLLREPRSLRFLITIVFGLAFLLAFRPLGCCNDENADPLELASEAAASNAFGSVQVGESSSTAEEEISTVEESVVEGRTEQDEPSPEETNDEEKSGFEFAEVNKAVLASDIPTVDKQTQIFMGHKSTNTGWIVDTRCFVNRGKPLIGYGVGCGEDVSWDVGMVTRYNFDMFLFDPTPKSIKYVKKVQQRYPEKITFTEEGLSAKQGELVFTKPQLNAHVSMRAGVHSSDKKKIVRVPVNTLRNWMQKYGHTYLDVFKIDIEGSEYEVLEQLIEEQYFPFTQILIEFHQRWFTDGFDNPRHQAVLDGLRKAGFVPYAKRHGNQEISYIKVKDLGYCVNGGEDVRTPYV